MPSAPSSSASLTSGEVRAAWRWMAKRYGYNMSDANTMAIAAGLAQARKRAVGAELAPAAIFYAFCRRAAFPRPVRLPMAYMLTIIQARALGLDVRVDPGRVRYAAERLRSQDGAPRWSFQRFAQEVETWLVPF